MYQVFNVKESSTPPMSFPRTQESREISHFWIPLQFIPHLMRGGSDGLGDFLRDHQT